jgi:putative tryptophan/tyrosine transport system substrate-binding protein
MSRDATLALNTVTLTRAFDQFAREKIEALLVPPDVTFAASGTHIAELAAKARLPAIFFNPESARAGGLMSYGPDLTENYRRAATFVDKILMVRNPLTCRSSGR